MDEASGTAIADLLTRPLGTDTPQPAIVAGIVSNARSFPGDGSQSANRDGDAAAAALFIDGPYTIEAWVKPDASFAGVGTGRSIFGYAGATHSDFMDETLATRANLYLGTAGALGTEWHSAVGPLVYRYSASDVGAVTFGAWNHVAVRVIPASPTTVTTEFFANGVSNGGVHTVVKSVAGTASACRFTLGQLYTVEKFFGVIDDVRISSVARTDAEILASYQRGIPGVP